MPGLTHTLRPAAALAALLALVACGDGGILDHDRALVAAIGDPEAGRQLILDVGCGTCHTIPGIRGATGLVGPPLTSMARRAYLAGVLRNTPDAMVEWLRFPQRIVPGNAMPDMGLSDAQARNITAYLYTLR